MTIKLNTDLLPIFSGTYGTIWNLGDFLERYAECGEFDINNLDIDSSQYMGDIRLCYSDNLNLINEYMPEWFRVTSIDGVWSPREYNFNNDQIDFSAEIDIEQLLQNLPPEQYLRDHFTSYDGFMSFTPNNQVDLIYQIKNQGKEFEQSIGAVVAYIVDCKELELNICQDFIEQGYGLESISINKEG